MRCLPYVYRGENLLTGELYFGYRKANKIPSEQDLGFFYFSSSREIRNRFSEFTWTVLAEFFIPEDAYDFEQSLIFEYWGDKKLINKHCTHGKKRWKPIGNPRSPESNAKRSATLKGRKSPMKGRTFVMTEERKRNISKSLTGVKHSQERNKVSSERRKGKRLGKENPMFGKHHSDEALQKMRKPKTEEHKQSFQKPESDIYKQKELNEILHCNRNLQ